MFRIILVLIIFLGGVMLDAQTDRIGEFVHETNTEFIHETNVEFTDFTGLNLEGLVDVFYTQSENKSIVIKTQQIEHINDVTYSIRNNTLTIRNDIRDARQGRQVRRGLFGRNTTVIVDGNGNNRRIQVFIESPSIESFRHSGVGVITFSENVDLNKLHFQISGVANVNAQSLNVSDLEIRSSGVANVNIAGNAINVKVVSSGVGSVNLGSLVSAKADVNVTGVGSVSVHSTDELNARITGVGSIRYRGNPNITRSVGFLGSLSRIGD